MASYEKSIVRPAMVQGKLALPSLDLSRSGKSLIRHPSNPKVGSPFRHLAWPLIAFMVLLLMPPETSLAIGSLRLSPYRMLLIVGSLMALTRLLSGRCGRVILTDWFIAGHVFWVLLSLFQYGGIGTGFESGGVYGLEAAGSYLLARAYIRNSSDYRAMLKLHLMLVAVLAVCVIPESLTGIHFVRDVARSVLGGVGPHYMDPRLGLERAFGPFEHPILLGVFASSVLTGAVLVLGMGQASVGNIKRIALVGITTLMSLSGGPIVAFALQAVLIGWERVSRLLRGRWYVALSGLGFLYIAIDLISTRTPVLVFIQYLTFSRESAYNRVHIWNYGTEEILRYPMFGIGLGDWERASWMSSSMDNFWLLTAMRYGLPALLFLLAAIVALLFALIRKHNVDPILRQSRLAWGITMISLAVVGLTVHFWNNIFCLFFFLIGSGAWMATMPNQRIQALRNNPRQMEVADD
tara:strand:- start:2234 stop:3628 length:1395 start_codon:yes stop_codon:yes gene_type:complete